MSSQAEPSWCRTTFGDTAVATFRWTIDNFMNRPEKSKEKLESADFNVNGPGDLKTKWRLSLYPKGIAETNEDYIAVYLRNKGQVKVMAKDTFEILDCAGNGRKRSKSTPVEYEALYSSRGKSKWFKRDGLKDHPDLLPEGNLTIQCTVTIFGPQKTLSGLDFSTNSNLLVHCQKQVGEHLGQFFTDKQFTDIKILCEGQSFECHMAILAARSPVFMAMFQSDMKEKETRTVTIDDCKAGVVGEMLNFIYTGNVSSSHNSLSDIASELLEAADKYQLDLLKNICEESLCSTLKVINCVEYLVLGDMYHTSKLKKTALRLVVENADSIIDSDVFKDLFKQKPELAFEVTKALNKK